MGKGASFEREICKQLSLWWSDGTRDDLFWRTQGSGGRATNRSRQGKTTEGQDSDVCATDSSAEPFTKRFTLELKCGYKKDHCIHMIDKPGDGLTTYEKWLHKLIACHKRAGTWAWMLIHLRKGRQTLAFMPSFAAVRLSSMSSGPFARFDLRLDAYRNVQTVTKVHCFRLCDWLRDVEPQDVKEVPWSKHNNEEG